MNNGVILILGATGDLARKKIFPALYQLFIKNNLENSIIIGAALEVFSQDIFVGMLYEWVKPQDLFLWEEFCKRIYYYPIDFLKEKDFDTLSIAVKELEKKHHLCHNRIVYCATAAYFYCSITHNLARVHLIINTKQQKDICHRIIYEKPFGHDLQSAKEINRCIALYFEESQIYRVDHYLSKELVSNIALMRFTNIIFEPLWNNRYIDQVQIIFDENIGLEGRGAFYDKYGALADVVQNHMMQLVALIGMEAPKKLTGDYIQTARAEVLQKVKVVDALLGQYDGYTDEQGIPQDSNTETFAQVYLRIENARWAGVPFYLKTGKHLHKKETSIYIKFKKVDCLLSRACPSESNYLTIEISPKPIFSLSLNTKKSGDSQEVAPVKMQFCNTLYAEESFTAYEILLQEILKDERSISVRFDEIEYAWNIIGAIRELKPSLYPYKKDTPGPQEAQTLFNKKYGIRWIT